MSDTHKPGLTDTASVSCSHTQTDALSSHITRLINETCFCLPLNRTDLDETILSNVSHADTLHKLLTERPNLFAATPVFISKEDLDTMQEVIKAAEAIIDLPEYQKVIFERTASQAPRSQQKTHGLFMGYDFHMTIAGPELIEINTNAGGAFLVNKLLQAIKLSELCCHSQRLIKGEKAEPFIIEMFRHEWQAAGRAGQPRVVAIVDDAPQEQYLYPDMLLAQDLLSRHGIQTLIVEASDLTYQEGTLFYDGTPIDMVYNRLTDFSCSDNRHAALQTAYQEDAVVLSPSPDHHALFANKRNLTLLSDPETLQKWGASSEQLAALTHIPKTQLVTPDKAEQFWETRKNYFFKPVSGYGGKAAYRGEKITRKVWSDILNGAYVAQEYIEPSARMIEIDHTRTPRKFDIRLYTYAGECFLMAARVYQGQTTNFRTPGGGFAPVIVV